MGILNKNNNLWRVRCQTGFWGLINPQWNMCNKGRRQSPINIEPEKLLFDPYLRPLHIDKHKVVSDEMQVAWNWQNFINFALLHS